MAPHPRWQELVRNYLDRRAADSERAELEEMLAQHPEAADAFAEASWMEGWLADLLKDDNGQRRETAFLKALEGQLTRPEPRRCGRQPSWRLVGSMAAALLIALGVSIWFFQPPPAAVLARLEQVQGEVHVVAPLARSVARAGQELLSGQGLQVGGDESRAVVVYPDGTRLEVAADTILAELSGRRVVLAEGSCTAEVTRQPPGRPMILATPHAEVLVEENRFNLSHGAAITYLEMEQGAARLTRSADGRSIEVNAGFHALVTGTVEPLASQPLPPRLRTARLVRDGYWGAALSPDGKLLLAPQYVGGTVKLLEVATAQVQGQLLGHAHRVECTAYSPDGRLLATGSADRTIKLWEVATGQLKATLDQHPAPVQAIAFDRTSQTLVALASPSALDSDKTLITWDLQTYERRSVSTYSTRFWALSPGGKNLATASKEGPSTVTLIDVATGQSQRVFQGFSGRVRALAFSPDGAVLAVYSFCGGGMVTLCDVNTGVVRGTFRALGPLVLSLAVSADGATLATGHKDGTVRLWDIGTRRPLAVFDGHGGPVLALSFGDGDRLLLAGKVRQLTDGHATGVAIHLWDVPAEPRDRLPEEFEP